MTVRAQEVDVALNVIALALDDPNPSYRLVARKALGELRGYIDRLEQFADMVIKEDD